MLDPLTLDQLRVFVAVADAGSFRAGAAALNRAQSAVSHAIATLEGQLGLSLFDRSGHRPALTAEGRALVSEARAILMKVSAMRARARGLGHKVELGLALAVDPLFSMASLSAALDELHRAYPSVEIRVAASSLGGPVLALKERDCTFGIVVGDEVSDSRIEFEALSSITMIAVTGATHPLARRASKNKPVSAVELSDHLQIVVEDPSPLTRGRDFRVLSPVSWRVSDVATKHALILAGIGWGTLPSWMIERNLSEGRLVRLPVARLGRKGETSLPAFLARRVDEPLGPAALMLRQTLRRQLAARR